jgi:cytochrome c-type biogenesis protein CcmE
MSSHIKVLGTLAVVAAAGLLLYTSMADAEQHYHFVQEVMPNPDDWVGKAFKIHGIVEAGSVREEIVGQKTHRQFVLEAKCEEEPGAAKPPPPCPRGRDLRILVKGTGPKPDSFKELAEVIATGTLAKENDLFVFHATELSATCPSKYKDTDRPSDYGQPR